MTARSERPTEGPTPEPWPIPPGKIIRCMGCVPGITVTTHYCNGGKLMQPYGWRCQCPEPGCAGSTADPGSTATPARRQRRA